MSWHRIKPPVKCQGCQKGDWCLVNDKGTEFLCMRVQTARPIELADGSVGWVHGDGGSPAPRPARHDKPRPVVNFEPYHQWLLGRNKPEWRERLARQLGLSYSSICALGAAWDSTRQVWVFPMRNWCGVVIGLRTRGMDGEKSTITGGRNGLFIPEDDYQNCTLHLAEGPTDTAAAQMIGLKCIGRFSCNGGANDIVQFIHKHRVKELVIIADNDEDKQRPDGSTYNPGLDGAELLVRRLPVRSCVITVPCKDLRDYVRNGGRAAGLQASVRATVWRRPAVQDKT